MNNDITQHVIIDNGSFTVKSGLNGDNAPRSCIQSIVGQLKNNTSSLFHDDEYYVGEECLYNSANLDLIYPLEKLGNPNISLMEDIWDMVFYDELKVSPDAHNVFLVESTFSNLKSRKEMSEIMFEKFNIFNIHIEPQGALALWSTPKSTGLVIESDHLTTQIIPVYDRHLITPGFKSLEFAGLQMTRLFEEEIKKQLPRNCFLSNSKEFARQVKENLANFYCDVNSSVTYNLPDGNIINLGREISNIPNLIFNPSDIGLDIQPLHEAIYESIMKCDIHIRKELLGNILLCGGNSMIKGFPERLKEKLEETLGKNFQGCVRINANSDRKFSVWTGASVICSITNFQNMWIPKNDYDEMGDSLLLRNLFIG